MSIITFASNEKKETGQTLSLAAVASYMAIEHNCKILIVSTNFDDLSLENCFWEYENLRQESGLSRAGVGIESGIEGLIKVINSNKTTKEIVKNYSKTILRGRLDLLPSPDTKSYNDYIEIASNYPTILQMADQYYDLIFVDLSKFIPNQIEQTILKMSDIVVLSIKQCLKTIKDFIKLREEDNFYKKQNVMIAIGRYDRFSKYNNKNITRYMKEKKELSVIPYNTLFFEACSDGTIIDFLLKIRNLTDETDRNTSFVKELKEIDINIMMRLKELQMRI